MEMSTTQKRKSSKPKRTEGAVSQSQKPESARKEIPGNAPRSVQNMPPEPDDRETLVAPYYPSWDAA
jgi:hypothetical protein